LIPSRFFVTGEIPPSFGGVPGTVRLGWQAGIGNTQVLHGESFGLLLDHVLLLRVILAMYGLERLPWSLYSQRPECFEYHRDFCTIAIE